MTRRTGKRRIFLWFFLAMQVLFAVWVITGAASRGPDTASQAAALCAHGAWSPLYSSQAACIAQGGQLLAAASDAGKGIALGLIIGLWVAADVIVGGSYAVYRLASRRRP